jgi:hypothetical protein
MLQHVWQWEALACEIASRLAQADAVLPAEARRPDLLVRDLVTDEVVRHLFRSHAGADYTRVRDFLNQPATPFEGPVFLDALDEYRSASGSGTQSLELIAGAWNGPAAAP